MSLLLDFDRPRTVIWEQADVTMDIIPLTTDVDMRFVRDSTKEVFDGEQFKKLDRDVVAYNRMIGQHCIKAWSGVYLDNDTQAECTAENIAKVMRIQSVENFVLGKVFGLEVVLRKEVDKAKKE